MGWGRMGPPAPAIHSLTHRTMAGRPCRRLALLHALFWVGRESGRKPPTGTAVHRPPADQGMSKCSTGPAPLAPALLRCFPSPAVASAVHVTGRVTPDVDYVSIELALATDLLPRVHRTVAADAGAFDAAVPVASLVGMAGGKATSAFAVAVRAHRRGCAEDGGDFTFSELAWYAGGCAASAGDISSDAAAAGDWPLVGMPANALAPTLAAAAASPPPASTGLPLGPPEPPHPSALPPPPPPPLSAGAPPPSREPPPTFWLEVFRMSEFGRMLPDFLDNHDSGDTGGAGVAASLFLGIPAAQRGAIAAGPRGGNTGRFGPDSGAGAGPAGGGRQRQLFSAAGVRDGSYAGGGGLGGGGGGAGGLSGDSSTYRRVGGGQRVRLSGEVGGAARGGSSSVRFTGARFGAPPFTPTLWTRYCVNALETKVANTTTTSFAGRPTASRFADYRSTNAWSLVLDGAPTRGSYFWTLAADASPGAGGAEYGSWCDLAEDRAIGQLSRENILAARCVSVPSVWDRFGACLGGEMGRSTNPSAFSACHATSFTPPAVHTTRVLPCATRQPRPPRPGSGY
eukprot:scaffold1957_cov110-Isochrysis_galbana.AAC.5